MTVDDLLALAMALHVAPAALLVPWEDDERVEIVGLGGKMVARLNGEEAFAWIVGAADPNVLLGMGVPPPSYFGVTPSSVQRRYGAELIRRLREEAGWEIANDGSYVAASSGFSVHWSPDKEGPK